MGEWFSLSLRERAGVRGKAVNDFKSGFIANTLGSTCELLSQLFSQENRIGLALKVRIA
jgi:hypothetical protein